MSGILAEAADVLGQVRRDVSQVLGGGDIALLLELAHDPGDVQGTVEDLRFSELVANNALNFAVFWCSTESLSVITPPLPKPIHWEQPLNSSRMPRCAGG
ncbi:hypothetical protein [Streptomyces sp. NPDC048527]|uniref:hypothetical protein n=1 Tax=Streptomyces sp. NPDC048527 TaxID=3365568 RepID=UPI00371F9F76